MLLDQGALESERPGGFGVAMPRGLCPLGRAGEEVDDGQHDPTLPLCEPHGSSEGMPPAGAAGHSTGFRHSMDENREPAPDATGV